MKKLTLLAVALTSTLLASCSGSGNPAIGKSYSFKDISTSYSGCTEEEFFNQTYNLFFPNKAEYETTVKKLLLSARSDGSIATKNGKLNIGNIAPTNKTVFNGKETLIYDVNHEEISEHVVTNLCSFGLDPNNTKISHFYRTKVDVETQVIDCALFELLSPASILHGHYYEFICKDNGISLDGSTFCVNLTTVLNYYEDYGVRANPSVSYNATTVVNFTL